MTFPTKLPASQQDYALAEAFILATTPTHVIATFVLLARIITRTTPVWRLTIDDYLICLGYAQASVMYGLMIAGEAYVVGSDRPPFRPTESIEYTVKMSAISTPFWAWSIGIVKISIACMLLRFQQTRGWRIFLYILILLNLGIIGFTGIAGLFECIPFSARWDIRGTIEHKRCWGDTMEDVCLYLTSILNVGTDVVFSVIPLTFLRKIRRPLKEKIVIAFLMALGLVASALSLTKVIFAAQMDSSDDKMARGVMIVMFSCLEVQAGIIAACIPTLRSSSRRFLQRFGILSPTEMTGANRYGEGSSFSGGPRGQSRFINMGHLHMRSASGHYSGNSSQQQLSNAHGENSSRSPHVEEEEHDEASYVMDPKTGRIMRVTDLKQNPSRDTLREAWLDDAPKVEERDGGRRSPEWPLSNDESEPAKSREGSTWFRSSLT